MEVPVFDACDDGVKMATADDAIWSDCALIKKHTDDHELIRLGISRRITSVTDEFWMGTDLATTVAVRDMEKETRKEKL